MNKNQTCPLRKIVGYDGFISDDNQRQGVILECGHRIIVSTRTTYKARCWKCKNSK